MLVSSTVNSPATVPKVASAAARSRTYPGGGGVCSVSSADSPVATDWACAVIAAPARLATLILAMARADFMGRLVIALELNVAVGLNVKSQQSHAPFARLHGTQVSFM